MSHWLGKKMAGIETHRNPCTSSQFKVYSQSHGHWNGSVSCVKDSFDADYEKDLTSIKNITFHSGIIYRLSSRLGFFRLMEFEHNVENVNFVCFNRKLKLVSTKPMPVSWPSDHAMHGFTRIKSKLVSAMQVTID